MYFIFSDVHGCLNEMNTILKYWNRKSETLVFLGDMIDRGYQVIILRGNHDDEFIKWLRLEPELRRLYYNNSLHETLRSFYHLNPKKFKKDTRRQRADYVKKHFPEIVHFLRTLPYYYETENCIFVHAGINMNSSNWKEDKEAMLWIREEFYNSPYISKKRIFTGHTPTKLLNNKDNEIWLSKYKDKVLIDGGCVFNGQLNGIKVDELGHINEIVKVEKSNNDWKVKKNEKRVSTVAFSNMG